MKRLLSLLLLLLVFTGCSFAKEYTDAMELTEDNLTNEAFDDALVSIELALNEKPEDEIALNIKAGLQTYNKLEKHTEKREWKEAADTIDSFALLDSVHPKIIKRIDANKKIMNEQVKLEKNLVKSILKINEHMEKKSFKDAEQLLAEIELNNDYHFANDEIEKVRVDFNEKYTLFKKEEEIAREKEKYNDILLKHEASLSEAKKVEHSLGDNVDTDYPTLKKTEKTYDEILNEVYQDVIKAMPKEEDKLREKQREWLQDYEQSMMEISSENTRLESSYKLKKERTLELLKEYF